MATVGERWRGHYERLREPGDLARWCREAGLLDETVPTTPGGLEDARELREAIHRYAKDVIARRPPDAVDGDVIQAAAAAPPLIPVLRSATRRLTAPPEGAERAVLSTIARDAIDLFTGTAADRIRECASPECALLFVDTSRPGRRRWCSSSACGGRERAAAYRRRRSSSR